MPQLASRSTKCSSGSSGRGAMTLSARAIIGQALQVEQRAAMALTRSSSRRVNNRGGRASFNSWRIRSAQADLSAKPWYSYFKPQSPRVLARSLATRTTRAAGYVNCDVFAYGGINPNTTQRPQVAHCALSAFIAASRLASKSSALIAMPPAAMSWAARWTIKSRALVSRTLQATVASAVWGRVAAVACTSNAKAFSDRFRAGLMARLSAQYRQRCLREEGYRHLAEVKRGG